MGSLKVLTKIVPPYQLCPTYFLKVADIKETLNGTKRQGYNQTEKCVIYWLRCHWLDCYEEYTRQSPRIFDKRFKEHLKAPSPIYEH